MARVRPFVAGIPPAFWLAVVLALAAMLRLGALAFDYGHPDEVIAVKVPQALIARGSLDTNWIHADLPVDFKLPQYNFSGYLLAMAGALLVKAWAPGAEAVSALSWLRALSALMGVACVFMTYVVGRQFFGRAAGLLAALLVTVNPLLLQDTLYARPETFVTLLTLLLVWLLGAGPAPGTRRAFAAAFIAGLLVATKLSMLLLLPLLLLAVPQASLALRGADWGPRLRDAWPRVRWLAAGTALGFLAGAPAAIGNLADFIEGAMFLRAQYSGGHWPYGVHDGLAVARFLHAAGYFGATTGALFVLAGAGAVAAARSRRQRELAVFATAFVTALQFALYPAFFERNLSHVLPVFAIFAAHGALQLATRFAPAGAVRALLFALLALAMLLPAARTSAALRWKALPDRKREAINHILSWYGADPNVRIIHPGWHRHVNDVRGTFGGWCGPMLLQMPTPGDAHSQRVIEELKAQDGFREVARIPSVFANIRTSTLHTYFTPTYAFLFRPAEPATCRRAGGGLVARSMVGEPLRLLSTRTDAGWTRGGAIQVAHDPLVGSGFYSSWSGSDAARGRLRMVVDVDGSEFIVLPYVTGPATSDLTTRMVDADSGKELFAARSRPSLHWQFAALLLPRGTKRLVFEAHDNGSGRGAWFAFGVPRRLGTTASD